MNQQRIWSKQPKRRGWFLPSVVFAFFLLVLWPAIAAFYTTLLWFSQLGYSQVFTTTLKTKLWLAAASGIVSAAVLLVNLRIARRYSPELPLADGYIEIEGERIAAPSFARLATKLALPAAIVLGLLFATSGWALWDTYLGFRHQVPFGKVDPVFSRDISFYVFTLPLLSAVADWLMTLLIVSFVATLLIYATKAIEDLSKKRFKLTLAPAPRAHLLILGALIFVAYAFETYLKLPALLLSSSGPIAGATYTDIHLRMPIYWLEISAALLGAVLALVTCFRSKAHLLWAGIVANALVFLLGAVVPPIFQRLSVAPNELAKETPYIERNIAATRQAFALDRIEERELGGDTVLTSADIQANRRTINNIRLWDQQPLLDTFAQLQEFRTYYDFKSVDNDRYTLDNAPQQVMLSARELSSTSLPNRNWINERLTFTHGYGLTLGPVDQVTPEGLPVLTIKDIPPASTEPTLKVTRPEIYFGEMTDDYVYVKTKAKEFDYPAGEQNVFSTYQGEGGIDIGSYWRRLLFATRLGDSKLLLSDDLTPESRVLIHRNIRERLEMIAPFLTYDSDPYLVISEGRLFWITDAYTTSDRYPYSQPASQGINYIRNSVKTVIDAYHGTVRFYLADEQDPLIQTYSRIYPGMFKPLSEMSPDLRSHLRYPEEIFRWQTAVYSIYHMDSPQVFYNKEDQWSVASMGDASEGQDSQVIDPYYTIMKLPGAQTEEFILMQPFTPRAKDNLASWMVARSDGENYGKLAVYRFPKQKLVYGPRQVLGRINQDPEISRQLTLWNQRGSKAIFGTLLVIPIKESLLYIQPLYLRADTGKIPELRRVIVVAENQIAMEPTLQASLNRLFGDGAIQRESAGTLANALPGTDQSKPSGQAPAATDSQKLLEEAKQSYDRALDELKRLRQVLDQISREKK